jgi:ElaB/YqjD/DUF883 family membrane-anchored ribosome-binding protein
MSTELTASNEAVHRTKEALLSDLKRVVRDADALLGEMSTSTVEEFASVRSRVEASLSEARSRIDDARILVTRKACGAADATNAYLHENPGKVIGIASLFGLITALLLFRRSCK